MKISKIQTCQPMKLKQNTTEQKQYNSSPAFKGVTSSVNCLPCIVRPIVKYGVIFAGTVLGAVSFISRIAQGEIDSNFKSSIYAEVVDPASDEGAHITESEMEDYNNAIAFYQQTKDEKIPLLGDSYKLKLLSNWTKCARHKPWQQMYDLGVLRILLQGHKQLCCGAS